MGAMQSIFAAPFSILRRWTFVSASLMGILLVGLLRAQQDEPKPLKPNDPRLNFSFAVSPDAQPFRFHVDLDRKGTIEGVSAYRRGETTPFQTLSSCGSFPDQIDTQWGWGDFTVLIAHADFNFDGYQDLELMQNYIPHLDTKVYCIFLWDNHAHLFRYSKELSDQGVNLEPDPKSKTLHARQDWMGGRGEDRTYRWTGEHLELIEVQGEDPNGPDAASPGKACDEIYCMQRIGGKVVTTLDKCVKDGKPRPECPAAPSQIAPQSSTPAPNAP